MSRKELERAGVMSRVESGDLKLGDAAQLMGVSYRQAKRIRGKYREHGAAGLRHGNAGKQSHRARPEAERSQILRLVGRTTEERRENALGRRWRRSIWSGSMDAR